MTRCFCSLFILLLLLIQHSFSSELPRGAHLSTHEWQLCEEFIKNEAPTYFSRGISYIHPEKTHPCTIEQDPVTGAIYIHLKGKKGAFIGEGGYKKVTKSILYGEKPELVARCQGDHSLNREAKVLSKLRGTTGIVQLRSFIKRPHKKSTITLEYFNAGSLKYVQYGELTIKKRELLPIMRDLIIGLKSLHKAGYIHRDLHRGNVLFNREKGVLHAALTDFGLALKMKEDLNSRISVQDSVCAPEVLLKNTRHIDRKKAEAYSLGVLFYYMIFSKRPAWWDVIKQFDLWKFSHSKKVHLYQKIQSLYKKTISCIPQRESLRKDLALLTFKLLNPDPEKRMYLDAALSQIDSIAKKWRHQKNVFSFIDSSRTQGRKTLDGQLFEYPFHLS
jgi:serine/threonine protein kinase